MSPLDTPQIHTQNLCKFDIQNFCKFCNTLLWHSHLLRRNVVPRGQLWPEQETRWTKLLTSKKLCTLISVLCKPLFRQNQNFVLLRKYTCGSHCQRGLQVPALLGARVEKEMEEKPTENTDSSSHCQRFN